MNIWYVLVIILTGKILSVNGPQSSCKYMDEKRKTFRPIAKDLIWMTINQVKDNSGVRFKRFYRSNSKSKLTNKGFVENVKNIKNVTKRKFPTSWEEIKNDTSNSMNKTKSFLKDKKSKIGQFYKNHTQPVGHPPGYHPTKPPCKPKKKKKTTTTITTTTTTTEITTTAMTTTTEMTTTASTQLLTTENFSQAPIIVNPKTEPYSFKLDESTSTTAKNSWFDCLERSPGRIKVVIDLKQKDSHKPQRNIGNKPAQVSIEYSNNATNVLVTAEEMATDLAGRVSSLWHCVLGSHRSPDLNDVKYFLYTRRNIIIPERLIVNYNLIKERSAGKQKSDVDCMDIDPEEIEDFKRINDENRDIIRSNFLSVKAPTKILIHGYTGSYKDSRMAKIKDAYLSRGRYNVIQVDWEILAAPPCYIRVTHHSKFVGETIAKFIDGLYLIGMNMSLVHLVGFSLGAQVAGFVGNTVTLTRLCRITGLDPALPLFLHTAPNGHLDKNDAEFVDIIHTCGGILAMLDPLGHVDFYPNGGTRQPGCEFSNLKCSHTRAPTYFAESVYSDKKFVGKLCNSWDEYLELEFNKSNTSSLRARYLNNRNIAYMGEPCSRRSEQGKYYLVTNDREPFAV